jgi:hypothetical protein
VDVAERAGETGREVINSSIRAIQVGTPRNITPGDV